MHLSKVIGLTKNYSFIKFVIRNSKNVILITLSENRDMLCVHKSQQLRNEIKGNFAVCTYRPY